MLIPKTAIKKLDTCGLEGLIVDCITRICDSDNKEYKNEQLTNAINGARQLKANQLGITVEQLVGEEGT